MAIATTNPATGEVLERYQEISDRELELCLERAAEAFKKQRLTTFPQRSGWMLRAAELLDAEQDDVARMMTVEMGKTVKSARAGGVKVRPGVPVLRRARRSAPCRRASRSSRCQRHVRLRQVPTPRCGPCRHAVELSSLAGDTFRGPGADGR